MKEHDLFGNVYYSGRIGSKLNSANEVFSCVSQETQEKVVRLYDALHEVTTLDAFVKASSEFMSSIQQLVLEFKRMHFGAKSGAYKYFLSSSFEEIGERFLMFVMSHMVSEKAQFLYLKDEILVGSDVLCWVGTFNNEIRKKRVDCCIYQTVRSISNRQYNRLLVGFDMKEYIDATMRALVEAIICYGREVGWDFGYFGVAENSATAVNSNVFVLRNQKRNKVLRDKGILGNDFQYSQFRALADRVVEVVNRLVDSPLQDLDITQYTESPASIIEDVKCDSDDEQELPYEIEFTH